MKMSSKSSEFLVVTINDTLKNNEEYKTFLIISSCLGYQLT